MNLTHEHNHPAQFHGAPTFSKIIFWQVSSLNTSQLKCQNQVYSQQPFFFRFFSFFKWEKYYQKLIHRKNMAIIDSASFSFIKTTEMLVESHKEHCFFSVLK